MLMVANDLHNEHAMDKYILEFGYKENEYGQIVIEIIPGLDKAVKKFSKMASLNDLNHTCSS